MKVKELIRRLKLCNLNDDISFYFLKTPQFNIKMELVMFIKLWQKESEIEVVKLFIIVKLIILKSQKITKQHLLI